MTHKSSFLNLFQNILQILSLNRAHSLVGTFPKLFPQPNLDFETMIESLTDNKIDSLLYKENPGQTSFVPRKGQVTTT